LIHPAFQSQKLSPFALPFPNDFLFLTVIFSQSAWISLIFEITGIVIFGVSGIFTANDSQHNDIAPLMVIDSEFRDKRGTDISPWHCPRLCVRPGKVPTKFRQRLNLVGTCGNFQE
jgi:hypothetical protein